MNKTSAVAVMIHAVSPSLKLGAGAAIQIEGLGGAPRQAKVAFLPPTIDESTRTLKVRFELDNEKGQIRPGAFATVEMTLDLGRALAVPESAVIHAGAQQVQHLLTHVFEL